MPETLRELVVDANVALRLIIPQVDTPLAERLFAYLTIGDGWIYHVPGFFYAECASTVARYVRLKELPVAEALGNLSDLVALDFAVFPTRDLARSALEISIAYRLNGYDAFYVALSAAVQAPLVTADARLVRATSGYYDVRHFADYVAQL